MLIIYFNYKGILQNWSYFYKNLQALDLKLYPQSPCFMPMPAALLIDDLVKLILFSSISCFTLLKGVCGILFSIITIRYVK